MPLYKLELKPALIRSENLKYDYVGSYLVRALDARAARKLVSTTPYGTDESSMAETCAAWADPDKSTCKLVVTNGTNRILMCERVFSS